MKGIDTGVFASVISKAESIKSPIIKLLSVTNILNSVDHNIALRINEFFPCPNILPFSILPYFARFFTALSAVKRTTQDTAWSIDIVAGFICNKPIFSNK
jgi:hypothetical protein